MRLKKTTLGKKNPSFQCPSLSTHNKLKAYHHELKIEKEEITAYLSMYFPASFLAHSQPNTAIMSSLGSSPQGVSSLGTSTRTKGKRVSFSSTTSMHEIPEEPVPSSSTQDEASQVASTQGPATQVISTQSPPLKSYRPAPPSSPTERPLQSVQEVDSSPLVNEIRRNRPAAADSTGTRDSAANPPNVEAPPNATDQSEAPIASPFVPPNSQTSTTPLSRPTSRPKSLISTPTSTAIACPQCHTVLRITLRISTQQFHSTPHNHPSIAGGSGSGPSNSNEERQTERRTYRIPPKPASFAGCQRCWEMMHNPAVLAESAAVKELGCCSGWGAKLERKLGWAFGVVFGECIKECRFGSRMCSYCDWVENIGWVKEWRRKRNIKKGKRVARSGSDRGDGDGGRSAQTLFVGNWDGDGDGEGGDGNEQGGSGGGNGGSEERDETGGEGASAAGQSESRESVTNRQFGEQSDEAHQETEYDRYQAEQAKKS